MRIDKCALCKGKLKVKKVECESCRISFEGDFFTSPILNLPATYQEFIELFILSSGSLKEMAGILGITYPTVRARLDEIIEALKAEIKGREDYKKNLLGRVEEGHISAEKAAEIIKNL